MARNFKKIVPRSASPPGDYDINGAFRVIEQELVSSMKRNWNKHNMDEKEEGFTWSRWQAEYLRGFEEFKAENKNKFKDDFKEINKNFFDQITLQHETNFFGVNRRRMEALIKSSTHDLKKAEHAMLRRCNDQYRKTMFNAQAYMNSGAGTLKQAIDMANKDFLKSGINCVRYKDGKTFNIASYAEMSLRTATTRATLLADGNFRNEMGVHTVKVSSYGACSKLCQPWQGKVYVDDVYSGGTAEEAERLKLPLLSTAIKGHLFHPNCRHHLSTYYPGTQNDDDGDPRDSSQALAYEHPPLERQHRINQLEIQRQKRIALGSMDPVTIEAANRRLAGLKKKDDELVDVLKKSSSAHRYEDITLRFAEENKPDGSSPMYEEKYATKDHEHEIYIINLISKHFGGKIIAQAESQIPGERKSDLLWNEKLWEIKRISSKSSVKNRIQSGLGQIEKNPGGFIFDVTNFKENVSNEQILEYIKDRFRQDVKFSCKIIMYRNDKFICVIDHKIKR